MTDYLWLIIPVFFLVVLVYDQIKFQINGKDQISPLKDAMKAAQKKQREQMKNRRRLK